MYVLISQLVLLGVHYDARVPRLLLLLLLLLRGEAPQSTCQPTELVRRGLLATRGEHLVLKVLVLGTALCGTAAGTRRGTIGSRVRVRRIEEVGRVCVRWVLAPELEELARVQSPAGIAVVVLGWRRLGSGAILGLCSAGGSAPRLGRLRHRHLLAGPKLLLVQNQVLGLQVAASNGLLALHPFLSSYIHNLLQILFSYFSQYVLHASPSSQN